MGDAASAVASAANKAVAAAKGPLHTLRGTGEEEKLLKNAKTEYWNEAEEIATYTAIETLAESVGDRETAQLARAIKRDEERMQSFLERLIPQLTKAVARAEIPAAERNGGASRRRTRKRSSAKRSKSSPKRSSRRGSGPASYAAENRRCRSATDAADASADHRLSPVCSRGRLPEIRYDLQTFTGRRPTSSGAQRRPAEGSGVGSVSGEASQHSGGGSLRWNSAGTCASARAGPASQSP